MESPHTPVLLNDVLKYLQPGKGESYLDLTAGYGGHAAEIIAVTEASQRATLVDRDHEAIAYLEAVFTGQDVQILHNDFLNASQMLVGKNKTFDMILADLGVSSLHLDKSQRGFSFAADAELDMRMDQQQYKTADHVVNTYSADDITRILKVYGEEPKARKMADAIVDARPIQSTSQLAKIALNIWPSGSKVHPATRLFQAIRIEVNDELKLLESALPLWFSLLKPGGRIVIISFHSLEDRIVKQAMRETTGDRYDADLRLLTKKPVKANADEIAINPRARSAKLRAAAKIKTSQK